jgi:hypothetical protein
MKYIGSALILALVNTGCAQKQLLLTTQNEVNRLKQDSALLEKRIVQLQSENGRLSAQGALIEQALTDKLQEKEEQLNQRNKQLTDRELSLKDMKARKEEEREAYTTLTNSIKAEFADYSPQTLTTQTTCTQTIIYVNPQLLFTGNTAKTEFLATELMQKAVNLLTRYPDLSLTISGDIDSSLLVPKETPTWSTLNRLLTLQKLGQNKNQQLFSKINILLGTINDKKRYSIALVFQSNMLPCIPIK